MRNSVCLEDMNLRYWPIHISHSGIYRGAARVVPASQRQRRSAGPARVGESGIRSSAECRRGPPAAAESVHPTALDLPPQGIGDGFGRSTSEAKALVVNGIDQLADGRRTLVRQVEGEHVAQLDPSKVRQIHRRNIAHGYDTEHDCRCEAGTSGAASRSDGCDSLNQSRCDSAPLLAWIGFRVAQ
jgi:hypothetical protein